MPTENSERENPHRAIEEVTDGSLDIPKTWHKDADDLTEAERECLIEREERGPIEIIEKPYDGDVHLDVPVKVRWTGYARARISEYNRDFASVKSERFMKAICRQKTQVVMETLEEADAVASELSNYSSGMQREWMNRSMDRALSRVQSEIIDSMADQGFTVVRDSVVGHVAGFEEESDHD